MLALLMASAAFAEAATLNLCFKVESEPVTGAQFKIYHVADWDGGNFALRGSFAHIPADMNDLDSEGWRALANTLSAYAARDAIAPDYTATTDEAGRLTVEGLNLGLYLAVGESILQDGRVFHPQPTLVALPARNSQGEWSTEVSADIKESIPEQGVINLTVMKIWQDGGSSERPAEITVELFGDGMAFDTVKLNKDNSWRYTWRNLDAQTTWQAVEAVVPDGYTVKIEREENIITITNAAPKQPDDGNLPQTGMNWWPVPLMAVLGMALFAGGWILRRKGGKQR